MLVVHGTRKFLDRVKAPTASDEDHSTTTLGAWFANGCDVQRSTSRFNETAEQQRDGFATYGSHDP